MQQLGLCCSEAKFKLTLLSRIAGLSDPSMSFCAAEVKSSRPEIGRYS